MKKVIICENERGFLFKNGKFVKVLMPGKYLAYGSMKIETVGTDDEITDVTCPLYTLLLDPVFAKETEVVELGDEEIALHYVNGNMKDVVTGAGKHAFWKGKDTHSFKRIDVSVPEVDSTIPDYVFSLIPDKLYHRIDVPEYCKARLFFNNQIVRLLEPGKYFFWKGATKVEYGLVDTRLHQMNISGQEIMTMDKVSLRINFVYKYRITDYVKVLTEVDDYLEQIHVTAQLALREYVGRYKLDEILENKDGLSDYVLGKLKEKEADFFVEIKDAGVKDIILPGEIRDIMNTVLIAEKKAQANVITRREEVASTRSLLNTAKLMDENETLYKLKELEFIERICDNVGNITLNGSGDLLSQLAGVIGKRNS